MASKELIEKVARAIADADMEDYREFSILYDAKAQAAISTILAALQEPTEGMYEAVNALSANDKLDADFDWRAMLAASPLVEKSE